MRISITKEQVAKLPRVEYPGKYFVIENATDEDKALSELRGCKLVGFDTETKPSFKKGQPNNVSLIQIASGDICYLFRINKIGLSDKLKKFIEDSQIQKIGLSLKDDFFVLNRSVKFTPAGFIDLQSFVKEYNIEDASLQKIYAILFGKKISKNQRLSNWEAEALTERQKIYASIDAWACLEIYNFLISGNFLPSQSPYIIEESSQEQES
ncbi:MAG: 3'-5' exonuclease domain-containing protein 2 [Paramuribaculum sp.]|nr:3'-5' exonuclease domain-containing protein 2 [Paramuribaculum sp.]